jgi:hypothetical protein
VDLDVLLPCHAGLDEERGDALAVVALELDDLAEVLVLDDDAAAAEVALEVAQDPGVVEAGADPLHRGQRLAAVALLHAQVHHVLGRRRVLGARGVGERVERRRQAAEVRRRGAGHETRLPVEAFFVLGRWRAGEEVLALALGRCAALGLGGALAALLRRCRLGRRDGYDLLLFVQGLQPPPGQRLRRRRRHLRGLFELGRRHVDG